jgi:hypothetical protein
MLPGRYGSVRRDADSLSKVAVRLEPFLRYRVVYQRNGCQIAQFLRVVTMNGLNTPFAHRT